MRRNFLDLEFIVTGFLYLWNNSIKNIPSILGIFFQIFKLIRKPREFFSDKFDQFKAYWKSLGKLKSADPRPPQNISDKRKPTTRAFNFLLLGETGVGKSTFINAFANYASFGTLDSAKESDNIMSLIPTSFTITDKNYKIRKISFGSDKNEINKPGQSATQNSRIYEFEFRNGLYLIRLIDTPGIGDTRGINQDTLNFDNILEFISNYSELHCICILLKPNNSRLNITFEFCIKQLLCHLDKTAAKNIVFIFTNSRGCFYRPGDTSDPLRQMLDDVRNNQPYVNIPFIKDTIYCLDNEAFRFLVALKNDENFNSNEIVDFSRSWSVSAQECQRLLSYVIGEGNKPGLAPHLVEKMLLVNNIRKQITNLSKPLVEIMQNIEENRKIQELHRNELELNKTNIKVLKKKLYIPFSDLKIIQIDYPKTVCHSLNCCKTYSINGVTKIEYPKACHEKCNLEGVTEGEIGHPRIYSCWAMVDGNCKVCLEKCNFKKHLHIYYETKTVNTRKEDEQIKGRIVTENNARSLAEDKINQIDQLIKENQIELEIIRKTIAKFACFLKNNAITPYNDKFKEYLQHYISNLRSNLDKDFNNKPLIEMMENQMIQYEEEKKLFDKELSNRKKITAEEILEAIDDLFNLEINGRKIKESQEKQVLARKNEIDSNRFQTDRFFTIDSPFPKKSKMHRFWYFLKSFFKF